MAIAVVSEPAKLRKEKVSKLLTRTFGEDTLAHCNVGFILHLAFPKVQSPALVL